ncbi:MAG: hypothetical protein HRU40_18065, partial [Saprospiraceae bacterium]|nr:hypothetical protein [Saprospiraceae bacterium]
QVTEIAPWQLINCQRGAFGTRARAHGEGSVIGKLLDHGYKTFLTNIDLTHDMSVRMADIYNETGLRQISFDGLEGNRSTGLGTYGESAMPYIWYTSLSAHLKDHLIIDASRTTHFFWHIFTRMNWGEPWYAGFRESQTAYRFNNQAYFQRNFIPGMLGWFKMTPQTSLADMEWLLAKTAGYDAGYALVTNPNIVSRNGYGGQILDRIGDWEKLRLGGIFSDDQKERLRNTELEFELTRLSEGNWSLTEISSHKFQHEKKELQPGQPTFSSLEWDITYESQPLVFQMTADQADVSEIMLEVDQYKSISIPIILKEGQHIQHRGSGVVSVFSESWQLIQTVLVPELSYTLDQGKHSLTVDASFTPAGASPQLKVELRTVTNREQLSILPTQ